jgi:hypothetical protein
MRRDLAAVVLFGLAVLYAATLHLWPGGDRELSGVVAGVGLLLAGELLFAAADRVRPPVLWLALCGLAAIPIAVATLLAGAAGVHRSLALTALGALAILGLVWLLARLLRAAASEL